MEDPLLASGSTRRRTGGFGGPGRQDSASISVLGRRAGAITSGNKYEKAAAMVDQNGSGERGQVLVTVGTTLFDALVRVVASQECRELLASLGYSSLVIQLGRGSFKPVESDAECGGLKVKHFEFTPSLGEYINSSSLVISHAGSGSIFETLRANRPLVVVVNDLLMDNHQCELAEELADRKHLVYASPATLVDTLRRMDLQALVPYPPSNPLALVNTLDRFLGFVDS